MSIKLECTIRFSTSTQINIHENTLNQSITNTHHTSLYITTKSRTHILEQCLLRYDVQRERERQSTLDTVLDYAQGNNTNINRIQNTHKSRNIHVVSHVYEHNHYLLIYLCMLCYFCYHVVNIWHTLQNIRRLLRLIVPK